MEKEKLIAEEQNILNEFVACVDDSISAMEEEKKRHDPKIDICALTPEAYGEFLSRLHKSNVINADIKNLIEGKDALYEYRMNLSYSCSDGTKGLDELKITKMPSLDDDGTVLWNPVSGDPLMVTWLHPLVRPYILDQELIEYTRKILDDFKVETITNYHLELKRKIDIRFEKVKNVEHMYPLTIEEAEKVFGDVFLAELARKRANKEFTDIIFTIQKKQGEIIRQEFNKNIIVQGCAGSGKSMIMLHRLPILLYDHHINRSNVYIISPSQSYIRLVNNMRKQLEINDIAMGTLVDYYEIAIGRYRVDKMPYDRINPLSLPSQIEKYIYSDDAVSDINSYFSELLNKVPYNIDIGCNALNITPKQTENRFWNGEISNRIINLSNLLTTNKSIINGMFKAVTNYISAMRSLKSGLSHRVHTIVTRIKLEIERNTAIKNTALQEIEKLNSDENKKAIENRLITIANADNRINILSHDLNSIEKDTDYSDYINELCDLANSQILMFDNLSDVFEENDIKDLYMLFNKYHALDSLLSEMIGIDSCFEDKYLKYTQSVDLDLKRLCSLMEDVRSADKSRIDYSLYKRITEWYDYYSKLSKNIITDTYYYIIEKSGHHFEKKAQNEGISCSPYVLLLILYLYYGKPNSYGENLIAIDEAQNLAPNEYKLIRKVNHNNVVLNIFGDVKQHIENTKGINSWSEIHDFESYELFELNENYRNASQITKYCNTKFKMNMLPINLDGIGVSEYKDFSAFLMKINDRMRKLSGAGLSAIIVANSDEAKDIKNKFDLFGSAINDLTGDRSEIYENKWNLMTVEQAKGLEFNCAVVIISNMTENEKYIACTRALDEMIVYSGEYSVKTSQKSDEKGIIAKPKSELKIEYTDLKPSKKAKSITISSENKKFFEDAGLKVIDERSVGGDLWLIGNKEKTRDIIMQARSKFKISSIQYGEKSPGVSGWHTKSKNV